MIKGYCLNCINETIKDKKLRRKDVVLTLGLDMCKGCMQYKRLVARYSLRYRIRLKLNKNRVLKRGAKK